MYRVHIWFELWVAEYPINRVQVKVEYEATLSETFTALISLQPLIGNQAYMPQMKAIYVLFCMVYGTVVVRAYLFLINTYKHTP